MTVSPIGPVAPVTSITPVAGISNTGTGGGGDFAAQLANGLNQLQQVQANADNLAVQSAAGTLNDPARLMVATTEASLATELTVAVRNKAVDAFNEIMRMQA